MAKSLTEQYMEQKRKRFLIKDEDLREAAMAVVSSQNKGGSENSSRSSAASDMADEYLSIRTRQQEQQSAARPYKPSYLSSTMQERGRDTLAAALEEREAASKRPYRSPVSESFHTLNSARQAAVFDNMTGNAASSNADLIGNAMQRKEEKEKQARIAELQRDRQTIAAELETAKMARNYGLMNSYTYELGDIDRELDELQNGTDYATHLQKQREQANAKLEEARKAVNDYTTQHGGSLINPGNTADPEVLKGLYQTLSDAYKEQERIDGLLEAAGYRSKYADETYEDTFWGQSQANYALGRMSQDESMAWYEYMSKPTAENLAKAQAVSETLAKFQEQNKLALDDENAKWTWLSKDLANWLPQGIDQTKYGATGAVGGGVAGTLVAPGAGTIAGAKLGATAAQALYGYQTMSGAAFKSMIDAGIPEDVARQAAQDEGIVSGLIEAAEFYGGLGKWNLKGWANFLKDYGINILSEGTEEGLQQAVSIANLNRVKDMEAADGFWDRVASPFKLAGESVGTAWDAATGQNDTARDEILDAAGQGAKLATMTGGVTRAAKLGAYKVAENMQITQSNAELGKAVKEAYGEDADAALVQKGLQSPQGTESHKLAVDLQGKVVNGQEISDAERGALFRANQEQIQTERQQTKERAERDMKTTEMFQTDDNASESPQETLEDAAREVVAREMGMAQESSLMGRLAPANVPSNDNPIVKQRQTLEQAVKAKTGYGEEGVRTFARLMEQTGDGNIDKLQSRFQAAYETGLTDMPESRVSFDNDIQKVAFQAGKLDYAKTIGQKAAAPKVSSKAGFDTRNMSSDGLPQGVKAVALPQDVTRSQVQTVDTMAKALGVEVRVVSGIKGNAEIRGNQVLISDSFQREVNGKQRSIVFYAAHEIGMHRLMQLAPTEGRAFINAMVQKQNEGLPTGTVTATEKQRNRYAEQGVYLSTEAAMEEVAADAVWDVLGGDEGVSAKLQEIMQGKDEQAKRGARKFRDVLRDLVKKFKAAVARLRGRERQEAQQALSELEDVVSVYETAFKAAVENRKQAEKNTAQTDGGKAQYSLEGKSFQEDKYFARQMDKWGELADGSRVKVGTVMEGSALNRVGLPASGMYFDVGKIRSAMDKHNDHLSPTVLKGIPDLLNDPIAITEYKGPSGDIKNTVNVYGNLFVDDKPVVVGIVMHLDRSGRNVINNIRTIHARSNFAKQITDDSVLYLNEDKKKTRKWFQVCGNLNVPLEGTRFGLIRSIAFEGDFVKNSLKEADAPVKQEISSAKTSIKQIPALFKDENVRFGKTNIDIGGGRFDLAKDYLAERGTKSMIFDPYNRSAQENSETLGFLQSGKRADTATCANVLNVIAEQDARSNVILEAAKAIKPGGTAYFFVYEGDRSGVGKQTTAGWQNNRKTADYMGEISEWFETVQRKGKLIIAKDPVKNLPKASWEVRPGEAVKYSLKEGYNSTVVLEERTVDKYLRDYASKSSPNYAQAYIAHISPQKFLDLTASFMGKSKIIGESRELHMEEFAEASRHQPLQLIIDHETGAVEGHEGRHRAVALINAGVDTMPVLLFDSSNKHNKERIPELVLKGQDFGSSKSYEIVGVRDLIPFNYANRDEIVRVFTQQPTNERLMEKYGKRDTVRYSLKDSEGNELTKEQQEYFKDSKVRDENGNLLVMYHGSQDAGFHVFDPRMSDDHTSLFFVDSPTVAKSYSSTNEIYAAKTLRTTEDFAQFFEEIGADEYEVEHRDGRYYLLEDGDEVADSDTAAGIYEEFQDWTGIGHGSANYKVYLNLQNPLIVDAGGGDWSAIKVPKSLRAAVRKSFGFNAPVLNTRQYAELANANGYDGVIFQNLRDVGVYASGADKYEPSTVAIAFESEQVKSTENKAPTSDPDIRFSLKTLDDIKAEYKDKTDHLYLHERNDTISIDNLVVKKAYRNQGVGTQILSDIIAYADETGKTITLTPTSEFGTKARLTKWYKANGFVENKGRNADYRLSDTMYRLPRPGTKYSLYEGASVEELRARLEGLEIKLAGMKKFNRRNFPSVQATKDFDERRAEYQAEARKLRQAIKTLSYPQVEGSGPVNSKAFAAWFGDWKSGKGSKVVDADGKPLVVYHGTGTTIEEFLPEFTGQGNDQYGSGFYFTTSKETAEHYTGATLNGQDKPGGMDNPNVIPVYLNIRKPIVVNAAETPNLYNFDVTPTMAARIIGKAPNIMDPEESILGDYIDEYWERGPQHYMISKLAKEYDWTLGSLETDIFRDYPTEFRQAVKDVLGYDGVQVNFNNGEKHYVAWFPNQIKHAYENSGAFSKKDNRIKFSLKEQGDILAENAKLKETVAGLREQFQTTKFAKVDKKSLDNFTKKLLQDYESGAEINEIRDSLDGLYTYMANGIDGESAVWEEACQMAYDVAREVLTGAVTLDDTLWQEYKPLRDHLRTTAITLSKQDRSDLEAYGGYNEFRKANMGRIKLTNDGVPVDTFYQELAVLWPDFFDAEEHTHPADQVAHIAEVLDSLKPLEVNPYTATMRESATWLANDIMERFFELPQAKPTFADKAERKLTQQVIKDAKKLERVRLQKNERIKQIIEKNREKVKQTQAKERAKRQEAVQEVKEHYKAKERKASESRKVREMRAKILRHTTELSKKLLRASDKNHIPQELQGTVAKLLESINLESNYTYDSQSDSYKKNDLGSPTMRTKLFANLRKQYTNLADDLTIDPDLLGDDGLLAEVVELADKKMADMNLTELETIWKAIRAIEASIQSANITFNQTRFATISEAAEALKMDNMMKREKVELDGPGGSLGKIQKLTGIDMMTPEAYFHRLGSAGDGLFRMMRSAQDDHIRKMKAVSDFTHEALKGVNVRKLESQMHTVKLGGQDVKLSTAQIMEMYVLLRREQAREHIMVGGILPDVVSKGGLKKVSKAEPVRGVQITEMFKAFELLTDEQKKIAETLQEYASTQLSKWGNEAAMKVYNYEKFGEKNYWPIRVNRQETNSSVPMDTQVTSVAGRGFTKGTKPHANNSVRIGSIFDTFATHASEMATYAAWLAPMEDINRIRNFRFKSEGQTVGTVKGIIDRVHGKQGTAYLAKLLADLSNGVKGTNSGTDYMGAIVGNYKAASVGANLRVIIQQPTAMLRAMDMLAPQYLVAGMRPANGWKKAKKYAPIAQWKDWGYFDINTGRQMKDVLFDSDSVVNKVKNISMAGAGAADSVSWGILWNAVETETKHKRQDLKPGTEEFYEAVAERFNEIVDHTQVVDGILQRSQIMRNPDGAAKMATSFMGEPTKQYNMLMSAAYDATHGVKSGKQKLARAAFALAVSGVANAMAQAVMDAVRDDDKEKDYWEKWLAALTGLTGDEETLGDKVKNFALEGNLGNTLNPVAYIPYAKDVLSLIQGYDVSRMDMESIEKTLSAAQNMVKALRGEGKYTIGGASASMFAEVSRLLGIPVANLKREVKSFAMLAAVETDNYLLQYRMEKASLALNYSSNSGTFMDILFKAYQNDQEAYEIIYKDMIESGYDSEKLANGMETRMKKAEGVNSVTDLDTRFLHPDQEPEYNRTMNSIRNSGLWSGASSDQRDKVEEKLYHLVTDSKTGEELQKKIDAGSKYGLDETEYLLYTLALDMYDKPNDEGKLGSYSSQEKADALLNLNLGDSEMAYLWDTDEGYAALDAGIGMDKYIEFKANVGDIKADKTEAGKTIAGSRKEKIIDYLNDLGISYDEYLWLLGTEYDTVKKEADYISRFGKE